MNDTDMNDTDQQHEQQLEEQLASATRWEGESPELWKKALDAAGDDTKRTAWWSSMTTQRRPSLAAAIVIISVAGILAGLLLPLGGKAREKARLSESEANLRQLAIAQQSYSTAGTPLAASPRGPGRRAGADGFAAEWASGYGEWSLDGVPFTRWPDVDGDGKILPGYIASTAGAPDGERHVARKAHMELIAEDVRSVFLRAAQLVSEARGEFVEESSLTGADENAMASLTLRVDAGRLSEVLNELRTLGVVHAEDSRGDDVTTQVVDLESRLRNERRVETELLELLDTRDDAPLREVLDLRQHLGQVRASIERMTAQQQRLSRLVSLASVLVIIRPTDAPIEEEPSLGGYFIESVGDSWTGGLQFLSDTIGGLLRIVIGGAIWWILVIAAIVLIQRARRQKSDVATA